MTRRRGYLMIVLALVIVVAGAAAVSLREDPQPPADRQRSSQETRPEIPRPPERSAGATITGVEQHLKAFADIARAHGGGRAAGTPGYDASADYVIERLERAGYEVTTQRVSLTAFVERTPSRLSVNGRRIGINRFKVMLFSGSDDVRGNVARVSGSAGGCASSDFEEFPRGSIALVAAANCTYIEQAANAEAAGATGVLFTPVQEEAGVGPLRGTLGESSQVSVPALGVTYDLGSRITNGRSVRIQVDAFKKRVRARNVIAQTASGRDESVVMVGAHLDSAVGSPGINDNASGSSVILELAEALVDKELRNGVRFGWWAAEEYGLLGSIHYVESLGEEERKSIAAYLNFDMLASPNFVRYVYEGEDEPDGSIAIEDEFRTWFRNRGLAIEGIPLEGRSDHAAFSRAGIRVGGLFTGANMLKTADETEMYGGTPGTGEDACYHLPCDDLDNINRAVLKQMTAAIVHVVGVMARTPGVIP
ncbi:MAG TPA: M28 family peptidase [Actinomycetota bacterium]|nr:M28 family peptidase [Actinomycetota bacterium]